MKHKFELSGNGRVRCNIDGKNLAVESGQIVAVDDNDENYSYFVNETRWEKVSHKEVKSDDLADDGIRNYSNEPMKNEKGRYKKEDKK